MAKRVNTKFLIILVAVLGLGAAAVTAKVFFFSKKNPAPYVKKGDEAAAAGNAAEAAAQYRTALMINGGNKDVLVKYGDAVYKLTGVDLENLQRARQAWAAALQIDPRYVPAMERLLDTYWDELEVRRPVSMFESVREIAGRLAETEAAPPALRNKAKARQNIAIIRQAEAGVPTKPGDIDKAIASLTELTKLEPANADILWYLSRAKVSRILELRRSPVGREESDKLVTEIGVMLDEALKGQEQNATMQLRAYQGYATLAQLTPRRTGADNKDQPNYVAKAKAALVAAREHSTPKDEGYIDVQLTAADAARRDNEPEQAAAVFRELLKNRPNDQRIRLAYARVYDRDPTKRDELIELLSRPVGDGSSAQGVDAMEYKVLEAETTAERTNLQITAYQATPDKERRKALLQEVRANIGKLESSGLFRAEHPIILKLRAKMNVLDGNLVDAVEAMDKAVRLTQASDPDYYDMKFQLADLYSQTGQTGQARKHLNDVIEKYGTYLPARIMRAQVMLKENDLAGAQEDLRVLKALKPDNAEVQRLEIVILERQQAGSATALIDKLPEGTRDEKFRKAQFLAALNEREIAANLLETIFKENPKDLAAVDLLVQIYTAADERDKALAVAQRALVAAPDSKPLQQAVVVLQKKLPKEAKETYAFQKDMIQQQQLDSLAREIKLYDLETQYGNVEEAEKHLAAAQAAGPEKIEVIIRQFGSFIRQGKFNEADAVVAKLSAANADDVGGFLYRFRLETERGRLPEALAAAQEMVKRRPNFAQGYVSLGQAQQAKGDYREAIQSYFQAIDKQPRNRDAMRGTIECQTFLNERTDARRTIDRARKLFPDDPLFRELEIGYELEYGDPETVIAGREKLYQANPNEPVNTLALAGALLRTAGQKYSGKANEAKARELRTRARDVLLACMKQNPADTRLVASSAEVLQALGDDAAAKKVLEEFAAMPGQSEKSATNLLLCDYYIRANQLDQAESQLREALQKSGGADVRQRLVRFLVGRRKYDDALALLDQTPDEPRAIAQRIEIQVAAKKYGEAEQAITAQLAKAVTPVSKTTGDYLRLQNLLTALYLESGQPAKALDSATRTLGTFKEDDAALYYRGLAKLGVTPPDLGGAVQDLSVVSDRSPKNVKVLLALAEANYKAGDTDAAILGQAKALSLDPLNKETRARLIDWHASLGHSSDVLRLVDEAKSKPELADEWAWDRSAAMVYAFRGEFPKALASIETALKLARDKDKPSLANDQLTIMYQAKDYAGMLRVTDQLLASGQKDWWIYLSRGMAHMGNKDQAAVGAELDKAFATVDPKGNPGEAETLMRTVANAIGAAEAARRVQPWLDLGWRWRLMAAEFNQNAGDIAAAGRLIDSVLGDVEKDGKPDQISNAYQRAASIYLLMQPQQVEKAVQMYEKVLALNPNDLFALNNMAYLLAEETKPPRPQEAKKYSQRAYDYVRRQSRTVGRDNLLIIDTHGWVLVLCGGADLDQGIRVLNEALGVEGFAEAYYHLGEALLRKGKASEAQDQLQAGLSLVEKNKQAGKPVDQKLETRLRAAADRAAQALQAQAR